MAAADSTIAYRSWAYYVKGNNLYLFEISDDNDYVAPTTDITDGLKVEFASGTAVFNDSDGFSDNTSPSETSYVNLPDSYQDALVAYVRARLAELKNEVQLMEYWDIKYRQRLHKAVQALEVGPAIAITRWPYAIR